MTPLDMALALVTDLRTTAGFRVGSSTNFTALPQIETAPHNRRTRRQKSRQELNQEFIYDFFYYHTNITYHNMIKLHT